MSGISIIRDDITGKLDALIKSKNVLPQIWKRNIKQLYIQYQTKRFMDMAFSGWQPLAESTIKSKQRTKPWTADRVLIYSGSLFRSITGSTTDGYREIVEDNKVTVSDTKSVGRYNLAGLHDEGGGRLPKRSLTSFNEKFQSGVKWIIVEALKSRVGKR